MRRVLSIAAFTVIRTDSALCETLCRNNRCILYLECSGVLGLFTYCTLKFVLFVIYLHSAVVLLLASSLVAFAC